MNRLPMVPLVLVTLLSACSAPTPAGPAPEPTPSATAAVALAHTSWSVTMINGTAALAGHEPTMDFDSGQVTGNASCNRYNASFTQDGATVTITPGVQTQMMCEEAVMTQEHAFTIALTLITAVRRAGETVELLDASANAVLTLAEVEDTPLEGTEWTLSGIVSGEAIAAPVADGAVTMTIADGTLTGKACNTFRGNVTAAEGSFKAGPLMSTRMACLSQALTTQETTVLKTLEAATSYTIAGNDLTITAEDGSGLVFTAAS